MDANPVEPSRPVYRMRGGSAVTDGASLEALQGRVLSHLTAGSPYTKEAVAANCDEFFTKLGLPSYYFDSTPPDVIAKHISSMIGACSRMIDAARAVRSQWFRAAAPRRPRTAWRHHSANRARAAAVKCACCSVHAALGRWALADPAWLPQRSARRLFRRAEPPKLRTL
jgi:hypothetical protein